MAQARHEGHLVRRWGVPIAGPVFIAALILRWSLRAAGTSGLLIGLALLAVIALAAFIAFAVLDWQTRRAWRALGRRDA